MKLFKRKPPKNHQVQSLQNGKWIVSILTILVMGCSKQHEVPVQSEAWTPIYLDNKEAKVIKSLQPIAPKVGGKIYVWNGYIFQLEPNRGIHVYKMEGKTAKALRFIQVFGAQEISIKNNILYTNNSKDIVSIDISNLENITEVGRVSNVFEIINTILPPDPGYFECPDPAKGVVIGWELKNNIRVKCKY